MVDRDREKRSQSRTFKRLPQQVRNELSDRGLVGIFAKIARKYHVTVDEAFSHNRTRHLVNARAEMYLYLVEQGWSVTPIAELFGRDYNSVFESLKRIRKMNAERDKGRASKSVEEDGVEGTVRRVG